MILHEIFHGIGFSTYFFPLYPYKIYQDFYQNGEKYKGFVSDALLQTVREYFKCDNINGLKTEHNTEILFSPINNLFIYSL